MRLSLALCIGIVALLPATSAHAHQPFFEENDTTPAAPIVVANPTISTALYATLDRTGDVDYFIFDGTTGTRVEIGITIPQIEGQEAFAPTVALVGPGLPGAESALLPDSQSREVANGVGLYLLQPTAATTFYEPFSRTSYWRRQRETVTLPADGRYTLVVWSAEKQTGRYTLVVGDREVMGGDPLFPLKMSSYWTPVKGEGISTATATTTVAPAANPERAPEATPSCHWLARLLARFRSHSQGC